MAITLSFGYIKNQTGDKGSVFWPDLEFNIQRINDHSHNGVNSAKLTNASIDSITQNILAAGWAFDVPSAAYKQTITVPAGVDLNKHYPRFKHVGTGEIVFLSATILSDSQYEVFINDNTVDLQVAYV